MIHITRGLVPFWDEYLTDKENTTATLSVNKARKEGTVMALDLPWETAAGTFVTILRDCDKYRMYYQVWKNYPDGDEGLDVCYAESVDGIRWDRPNLGIHEFNGSRDNNLLLVGICDNFFVMKDENPDCPPEHRYKAIMEGGFVKDNLGNQPSKKLICLTSADGIRFASVHHNKFRLGAHVSVRGLIGKIVRRGKTGGNGKAHG